MSEFEKRNNIEREKFVINFAKQLKLNENLKKEQIELIDNQIVNARDFYSRLLKTKGGYEKIIKKFNINNKNILKRLKKDSENNDINLIQKENKKFVFILI